MVGASREKLHHVARIHALCYFYVRVMRVFLNMLRSTLTYSLPINSVRHILAWKSYTDGGILIHFSFKL